MYFFLFLCAPLFSQEYAHIYITNGSGSNTVGTSWTNVGAGSAADYSEQASSTNWSYASNVLTAANTSAVDGVYLIKYSLSFYADDADWSLGVSIDGASPSEPVFIRTIAAGRTSDKGNMSGSLIVSLSQNQTVQLQVKASDTGNSFTPVHSQLVLTRISETSVNYYGGMHISSDQTYINLSDPAGTFVKLTGYAAFDELSDWTVSNSELTAGTNAAGTYLVVLSASFTGDNAGATPVDCSFDIYKDGTTSFNALAVRKTGDSDIGNISCAGIVSISSGSTISVWGAQSTKKLDLIMKKSTVSLYKIVDSTSVSYAGMKITSDEEVVIGTQSAWTTVDTFTSDIAYGWSLDTSKFRSCRQATGGYHFVDYTTSLTTANTSGDDIELGVFIGTRIHPEFTTSRRLSSNTDVGAVSGNAIFLVDHADSTITMKVRNTTSTNNITFKKAYLAAAQIRYVFTDNSLPITLNNFSAVQDKSAVVISWKTESETDNAWFLIYRNDEVIASIEGAGTTSEPNQYHYTDQHVIPGRTYTYELGDVSYAGEVVKHDAHAVVITINEGNVGKDFSIGPAYPNPFNPTTLIPLNLAKEAEVNAEMYDLNGRSVQALFNGSLSAGSYDLKINGHELSAGIYFIKIRVQEEVLYTKVTLLK